LQGAFPEADIQGLKEAAQLTRQEAVEALRHTRGNAQQALVNELDAMHLNQALVDSLVHEYASFRCALSLSKLAGCLCNIVPSVSLPWASDCCETAFTGA
jgi:hypothetical protein